MKRKTYVCIFFSQLSSCLLEFDNMSYTSHYGMIFRFPFFDRVALETLVVTKNFKLLISPKNWNQLLMLFEFRELSPFKKRKGILLKFL